MAGGPRSKGGDGGASPGAGMWAVAVVVTMATFMELLDTSISNVALRHVAGSLSTDVSESAWILTSYLVSNAVVVPLSAWLSGLMGRKRFYMTCVALFTISSMLCGMAPSLGWLIFFRVLQGAGGGGLAPSEQAILVDTFPENKRASAFALYSLAIVAAPAIGPTLGGWITENYSWRWTFFVNVPVGILSLILTAIVVPAGAGEVGGGGGRGEGKKRARTDWPGIVLVVLGFGCLEVVLDKGQEEDWFASRAIMVFAGVAAACIVGGIVWELFGAKEPVVNLRLLKDRNFALASWFFLFFGFVLFGSTVLLPQIAQQLLGYTATLAGLVLSPGAIVIMMMAPLIGMVLKHTQAKWLLCAGLVVTAVSLWRLSRVDLTVDYGTLAGDRVIQGVGIGLMFVPVTQIAYSYLPKSMNTQASSMTSLFRNLGGSFGIAFGQTMLARREQTHQAVLAPHVSSLNPRAEDALAHAAAFLRSAGLSAADAMQRAEALMYQQVHMQAQAMAYLDTFWLLGVVALLAAPVALLVRPFTAKEGAAGH